jgi:hypothetical protein
MKPASLGGTSAYYGCVGCGEFFSRHFSSKLAVCRWPTVRRVATDTEGLVPERMLSLPGGAEIASTRM